MKKFVYVLALPLLLTFSSYVKASDEKKVESLDVPTTGSFVSTLDVKNAAKNKADIKSVVNVIEISFSNDVYYMTFTAPNSSSGRTEIIKAEIAKRKDGCFYELEIGKGFRDDGSFSYTPKNFKTEDLNDRCVMCFKKESLKFGKFRNIIERSCGEYHNTYLEVNANGSQVQH